MADIEKIREEALPQLFHELQRDRIPLKLQLRNNDDIHSTFITDIRKRKKALHFLAEYPHGLQTLTKDRQTPRLRFEFIDNINIKHVFETESWEASGEMIWVKFPEYVRRYQRRRLFRLEAPQGTHLYFKENDIRYKLLVINVSLGGTFGVLGSSAKQMGQELKRHESKTLKNVELVFPSEDRKAAGAIVNIERCLIKRKEINPATNKSEYALEFIEISEEEMKNLTELFYKWQREYLRKRKIMRTK
jgi:c-di-GMP-binding flagellar brake protein YcgR